MKNREKYRTLIEYCLTIETENKDDGSVKETPEILN
jgi:hypothetical protein